MARQKKKREVQEINASSMADIAFLLLVFFLVTTTFDSDYGIQRRLPEKPPSDQPPPPPINRRNIFLILVNSKDEMYVNGEVGDINLLKEEVKNFILNPTNDETLSAKKEVVSEKWGKTILVSKGVVSLQTDRNTSYNRYIEVQNVLAAAFNDLKNDLALSEFKTSYDELKEMATKGNVKAKENVEKVDEAIPLSISEATPRKSGS
ncbi:MAG: biopolymer transporter ExbD [Flavobacteriales bacterium]|nr:biopolymer transporter ExbD [Flavobacteriales bacterium]